MVANILCRMSLLRFISRKPPDHPLWTPSPEVVPVPRRDVRADQTVTHEHGFYDHTLSHDALGEPCSVDNSAKVSGAWTGRRYEARGGIELSKSAVRGPGLGRLLGPAGVRICRTARWAAAMRLLRLRGTLATCHERAHGILRCRHAGLGRLLEVRPPARKTLCHSWTPRSVQGFSLLGYESSRRRRCARHPKGDLWTAAVPLPVVVDNSLNRCRGWSAPDEARRARRSCRRSPGRKQAPSGRTRSTPARWTAASTREASSRRIRSAAASTTPAGAAPERSAACHARAAGRQASPTCAQAVAAS